MTRIDRSMTIWLISMLVMVFVILPATVIITASISIESRANTEKPAPTFESEVEPYQPESRLLFWHTDDAFHRTYKSAKFYYSAPSTHTGSLSQ